MTHFQAITLPAGESWGLVADDRDRLYAVSLSPQAHMYIRDQLCHVVLYPEAFGDLDTHLHAMEIESEADLERLEKAVLEMTASIAAA